METSEGETAKVEAGQEVKDNEGKKAVAIESEKAEELDSNKATVDENKTETKEENDQSESKNDDTKTDEKKDEEKVDEKPEEKTTTETIMEIDGKKVKKTTGGAKKVPPSSVYKSNDREAQKQDRKKRAVEMRRRTLLISNITVEDIVNEKVKNVLENCYHCQIRFLQIKDGKRGIAECRFNTVEDATKAETELKEVVIEDRTIGIRNLEERAAPSTWYEIGKELDKYLKTGEAGKDEQVGGEKPAEPQKDPLEEELASCDETKTLVLLNLPLTTTEEMLQAIFSEASKIRMPVDDAGQCKGHAILEFETAEVTTECRTKYEGISIEDDQDDRLIYVQTIKEYKEKSKAKASRKRISSTRRSSRERSRILQMNWIRRGLIPRRGMRMRGRYSNWRPDSPKGKMMDKDRKFDIRTGRRDGGMNWGQNMMWNSEMMSNMPNLLSMMGSMPAASMMGINPFMGNAMNFQSNQYDNSNRNAENDYRNRKRKMNDQDFYRGDNRRGGGSGGGNWKNRRFDNQDNYGATASSYGSRDRGSRIPNRDRNSDNRSFRKQYYY